MKQLPDSMVKMLARYLPMLIENIDGKRMTENLRLNNAVRVIKGKILPRIERENNIKLQELR